MLISETTEPLVGGRWGWTPQLFRSVLGSSHLLLVLGSALIVRVAAGFVNAVVALPDGVAGIAAATVLGLMMVGLPAFGAVGEAREVSMITAAAGRDAGRGYPQLPGRARFVVGLATVGIAFGLIGSAVLVDGSTVDDASAIVVGTLFFAFQLRLVAWQLARWFRRR